METEGNNSAKLSASKKLSRYCVNKSDEIMTFDTQWCRVAYSDFEDMLSPAFNHSFYELHYTIKGDMHFSACGRSLDCPEGYFLIFPPGMHHSTDYVAPGTEKFVFGFHITTEKHYLQESLDKLQTVGVYPAGRHIDGLIDMMLGYAERNHPAASEVICSLVECLIIDVLDQIAPAQPEARDVSKSFDIDNRVATACTFIENNIMLGITYHDVAAHLNLSARQLNRDFKKHTGQTIEQTINAERVKYIKSLLRSNRSLASIAEEVGFSTEYSMNRFFKRYEGVSLGVWRQNILK